MVGTECFLSFVIFPFFRLGLREKQKLVDFKGLRMLRKAARHVVAAAF